MEDAGAVDLAQADECSPPAWGGRLAAALAMFLGRSQCTRAATRPLGHSVNQALSHSANQPLSNSAAMAALVPAELLTSLRTKNSSPGLRRIIDYSAYQKWQP